MPTRVIAGSFALIAFALAIVMGLYADNSVSTTLGRALVMMGLSYVVGLMVAVVAFRAMNDHFDRYKAAHPMPRFRDEEEPIEVEVVSENTAMGTQDASGGSAANDLSQPNAA